MYKVLTNSYNATNRLKISYQTERMRRITLHDKNRTAVVGGGLYVLWRGAG